MYGSRNLPDPNEKVGNAMYFAGVDIAKTRHELCVIDDSGDILLQLPLKNTKRGFEKLLTAFLSKQLTNKNVRFCLEATGHYWIVLYCQLEEPGFSVHVVNPIQSVALRISTSARLKLIRGIIHSRGPTTPWQRHFNSIGFRDYSQTANPFSNEI